MEGFEGFDAASAAARLRIRRRLAFALAGRRPAHLVGSASELARRALVNARAGWMPAVGNVATSVAFVASIATAIRIRPESNPHALALAPILLLLRDGVVFESLAGRKKYAPPLVAATVVLLLAAAADIARGAPSAAMATGATTRALGMNTASAWTANAAATGGDGARARVAVSDVSLAVGTNVHRHDTRARADQRARHRRRGRGRGEGSGVDVRRVRRRAVRRAAQSQSRGDGERCSARDGDGARASRARKGRCRACEPPRGPVSSSIYARVLASDGAFSRAAGPSDRGEEASRRCRVRKDTRRDSPEFGRGRALFRRPVATRPLRRA